MIRRSTLLLLATAAFLPAQDADLVIKAKTLYTGDGRVLTDAVVATAMGKILFVGSALPAGVKCAPENMLEASCVAPGFVEGSTSAGLPRGGAENEEGRETTAAWRAASSIDPSDEEFNRLLDAGVTTMVVVPGANNVFGGLSVAVKPRGGSAAAMTLKDGLSLQAVANRTPTGRNSPPGRGFFRSGAPDIYNRRPNTRMGVVFELRRGLQEGAGRASGKPWTPLYDEVDGVVLARAARGELPIAFVVSNATDVLTALRIAKEFGYANYYIQDAGEASFVAAELAERKIAALIGTVTFNVGPSSEDDRARLMAGPKVLHDAGVKFAISRGSSSEGTTLRDGAIAAARGGLPPGRAVAAITGDPAAIVGIGDRVGVIEAGMDADLLVFNGDLLSPAAALTAVILDGKTVRRFDAAPETRK